MPSFTSKLLVTILLACTSALTIAADCPVVPSTVAGISNALPADSGDKQWKWAEVAEAKCRDGSQTGMWFRNPANSNAPVGKKLVIFLEGGGGCFNKFTCNSNPQDGYGASFPRANGADADVVDGQLEDGPQVGMFDLGRTDNFFRDYTIVYIPYCTGDVFVGTHVKLFGAEDGIDAPNPTEQRFCGARNLEIMIKQVERTFIDGGVSIVEDFVFAGSSAGGFGAYMQYFKAREIFPDVLRATLIDDSGFVPNNGGIEPCLQTHMVETWAPAFVPECTSCATAESGGTEGFEQIYSVYADKYPNDNLLLASSKSDIVISLFASFGYDDCKWLDPLIPPLPFTAWAFRKSVNAVMKKHLSNDNDSWTGWTKIGFDHTDIQQNQFFTKDGTRQDKSYWSWSKLATMNELLNDTHGN